MEKVIKVWLKYYPVYLSGLWGTLWISAVTVFLGALLGMVVALMRMSRLKILRTVFNVYVEILRGTPILLQLYFFWIGLPKLVPFELGMTLERALSLSTELRRLYEGDDRVREVIDTATKLCREQGITVVLITHHMNEAEHADRVIVMNDGLVVMDGKPREVFTRKKELEDIGLAVPDTVSLLFSLREAGMDVPVDAITVEECADVIAKNFT